MDLLSALEWGSIHQRGDKTVTFDSSGDRGSTVVKVLCYNSEGRWFDSLKDSSRLAVTLCRVCHKETSKEHE